MLRGSSQLVTRKLATSPTSPRGSYEELVPVEFELNAARSLPQSRDSNRPMTCTSKCVTSLPAALAATHVYRPESACVVERKTSVRAAGSIRGARCASAANDPLMYHVTDGRGLPVLTRHVRASRRPSATMTSPPTSAMSGLTANIGGMAFRETDYWTEYEISKIHFLNA